MSGLAFLHQTATISFDDGHKNLGSLFRPIRALLRLCLGASRDLARREALFNVADAKVPPIQ